MMTKRTMVLGLVLAFLPIGCSAGKVAKRNASQIEARQPVVIEKTGKDKRPIWTSEQPFYEDRGALLFTGGYLGGADYALSLRLAKAEAMKNLLESIELKVRAEFSTAMHGQNSDDHDLGRYVTDGVAWTVDNLRIRGIKQNTTYYERIFVTTQVDRLKAEDY
jgi:hypothetical protein